MTATSVLFVLPNLAAGGVERQWSILLPGLRRRGIDARLIALDGGGPFEAPLRRAGVPVEVLGMRNRFDLGRLLRSRLLRSSRPDAVVSQSVSGLYVGQLIASARRAVHLYAEHAGVDIPLDRRREAMMRLLARRLDRVIVVSDEQAAIWRKRGFPAARVMVITNGIVAGAGGASKENLRERFGIDREAVVAVLVATLRPEKRVPDFIAAVASAHERDSSVIGLVVGDGPERVVVETAARLAPAVSLLGHRNDVEDLLRAADVFVLTSEQEAVPMSMLEAMAAELPLVATDVGGLRSVILSGENGWLVPVGDHAALAARLLELASDPARRMAMGAASARLVRERWDAEQMIDRYAELLVAGRS
jgi:L-malate glycosyltransferase